MVSSIAAGLALALPDRKVIAIDGDGAFLMNLCGLPTIALQSPPNQILSGFYSLESKPGFKIPFLSVAST